MVNGCIGTCKCTTLQRGVKATLRKEELQQLIKEQIELGGEGLEEKYKYLLEINLEDLVTTSGETQIYWLLAIQAAREGQRLRLERNVNGAEGNIT